MKYLRLYPDGTPASPIERVEPLDIDHDCTLCKLGASVKTVCMAAGATGTGGLLVVSDYPGRNEDKLGRPMVGAAGKLMRMAVKKFWSGPVVYDNAIKCAPGGVKVTDKHIAACSPYLSAIIEDAEPTRIIASGSHAIHAVLGRSRPPFSVRRGFGWLSDNTPVFMVMNPAAATRNPFVKQWFFDDMKWALTQDVRALKMRMPWHAFALIIEEPKDSRTACEDLRDHDWVSIDIESAGEMFDDFELLSFSITGADGDDAYVWDRDVFDRRDVMEPVIDLLADPAVPKVYQYGKHDIQGLYTHFGIDIPGYYLDTGLGRRIVDPEALTKLEIQQELVGLGGGKDEAQEARLEAIALCRKKVKKKPKTDAELKRIFGRDAKWAMKVRDCEAKQVGTYAYALIPKATRQRYVAIDSLSTAHVAREVVEPAVSAKKTSRKVWRELVRPAQEAFLDIQRWGMAVDRDSVDVLEAFLALRQRGLREWFDSEFGKDFNPGSTQQVAEVLFKELRLPVLERTKGGAPSTAKVVLEQLANHKKDKLGVCGHILDYKHVQKLAGQYAKGIVGFIRPDGRVHPSYKVDGARSGRPSCEAPNMFNIPRPETDEGKMCRDCFTVGGGDPDTEDEHVMLTFDLSQMELRTLAGLSGDPKMKEIFISGADFHYRTAQLIAKQAWDMRPEDVPKKGAERSTAKTINFAVVYGMGVKALAAKIGCSKTEAQNYQELIFGQQFRVANRWCEDRKREARKHGGVWTEWPLGEEARWRPLWRIASADDEEASRAENGAVNSPVQGTASDFCLASLIQVVAWCKANPKYKAKVVLTVYDSIMIECPRWAAQVVYDVVMRIMTQWPCNGVPLVVDCEAGRWWGSQYKVKKTKGGLVLVVPSGDEDDLGKPIYEDVEFDKYRFAA